MKAFIHLCIMVAACTVFSDTSGQKIGVSFNQYAITNSVTSGLLEASFGYPVNDKLTGYIYTGRGLNTKTGSPKLSVGLSLEGGFQTKKVVEPILRFSVKFYNGSFPTKKLPPNAFNSLSCYVPNALSALPELGLRYKFGKFSIPLTYGFGWSHPFGNLINPLACEFDKTRYKPEEIKSLSNSSIHQISIGLVYCLSSD